jgi:hypothetical protein
MKVIKDPHVVAASAEFGYRPGSMVMIGASLLACTVLYIIPRSAPLGAILLTGYLGGTVASNVRIGHPVFECIFPRDLSSPGVGRASSAGCRFAEYNCFPPGRLSKPQEPPHTELRSRELTRRRR